jgi:hypothetical protein
MMSKGKEHLQPLLPVVQQAIADQTKFIEQERPYASLLFPYGETTIRSPGCGSSHTQRRHPALQPARHQADVRDPSA